MRTIWKYEVPMLPGGHFLRVPMGAAIRKVACMNDRILTIWAEVLTTEETMRKLHLVVHGTGHEMPMDDTDRYIDTVFQGPFVWHVHERFERKAA